jgi:hypothetical protein
VQTGRLPRCLLGSLKGFTGPSAEASIKEEAAMTRLAVALARAAHPEVVGDGGQTVGAGY